MENKSVLLRVSRCNIQTLSVDYWLKMLQFSADYKSHTESGHRVLIGTNRVVVWSLIGEHASGQPAWRARSMTVETFHFNILQPYDHVLYVYELSILVVNPALKYVDIFCLLCDLKPDQSQSQVFTCVLSSYSIITKWIPSCTVHYTGSNTHFCLLSF